MNIIVNTTVNCLCMLSELSRIEELDSDTEIRCVKMLIYGNTSDVRMGYVVSHA